MRVFEAPDQTADAILRLYGEQFILNNTEYDEAWLKDFNNPKKNKKAIEELDWWMQEDMELLKKLLKDVRSGKIPEGASQWLCYQVIPLRYFGTYECTHNSPIQLLIYPEDLTRAIKTFDWYANNRKESEVQNKIREMYPDAKSGVRKIKNPLDWSIWEIEDIEAAMTPTNQAQQKNEAWMPETLGFAEEDAVVAFQEGDVMLVRLKTGDAAVRYASGTKWCTASKQIAENQYLRQGDLFVAVRNGNRIGQLHGHTNQIMNLQDQPLKDLPPSIARFMLKDELDELKKLAEEWPTDAELKKSWLDNKMKQLKESVKLQQAQLDRSLAIYEGNSIDEESYSRFLITRVFGTVDNVEIRLGLDSANEAYESALIDPPEPAPHEMVNLRSNSANRLSSLVHSINNMTERIPAQYRTTDATILPDDTVNKILTLANSSGVQLDVWQMTSLVNNPGPDLRKTVFNQLRETLEEARKSTWWMNLATSVNRYLTLAIRVDGYNIDDFYPGSTDLVTKCLNAIPPHTLHSQCWPLDASLGEVMTSIGRKESPAVPVVWLLKQAPLLQDNILPHIDATGSHGQHEVSKFVSFYATSSSSDPNVMPSDFAQLAKLPDATYEIVKGRLINATPRLGPETLVGYYNQTQITTIENYVAAVVDLVRRKEGDKKADLIASDLVKGAVDTSLIGRMQTWFRDTFYPQWVNNTTCSLLFATARPFWVNQELAIKQVMDNQNNQIRLHNYGNLEPLPGVSYWSVVGKDSEGNDGAFPIVDFTDTGDIFGNLLEAVDKDIADPTNSRMTPKSSGTGYGGYLKTFVEPNLPKSARMIKQINAKERARPPATLGFICTLCQYPVELDTTDGQWKHLEVDESQIRDFATRWEWNDFYWPYGQNDRTRCLFDGIEGLPYGEKVRKDLPRSERKQKVRGLPVAWSYSSDRDTPVIPMLDDHPHVPCIHHGATVLICDLCTGIRPVPPDAGTGGSYYQSAMLWSTARSNRPCKCGYTIRSLALYEAEEYEDYEPTEAEITEELTGALGSGGPRGLNQTAYEAEYTQISGDDMDTFLTNLGFTELPRRARTERIYDHVYGRGPNGDLVIRVYTSIIDGGGSAAARKVGADSIKVVPLYLDSTHGNIPLGKQKRVHRVTGWRDNLRSRIATAQEAAPGPVMDSSGKPMRLRRNKRTGDMFWGSIDFPQNRETRPYRG